MRIWDSSEEEESDEMDVDFGDSDDESVMLCRTVYVIFSGLEKFNETNKYTMN